MKLSTARSIYQHAKKTPLLWVGKAISDKFGSHADMKILGDHHGYFLQGNAEGTEWWVAHCVYGGSYAEGNTRQEALLNFANKQSWVKETAKKRKLAEKIVNKYGEGPIVEKEGNTYVARLSGKVVGKAENYSAALKMGERAET